MRALSLSTCPLPTCVRAIRSRSRRLGRQSAEEATNRAQFVRNTTGLRRGGPGRPKDVPNKASVEAKGFCSSIIDDPAYQQSIRERALKGKLAPAIEAMIWYYAKGKPKDQVESDVHHTYSWLPTPPPREQP